MDEHSPSPTFLERLLKRVAGSPADTEQLGGIIKQAQQQDTIDADTAQRLENVLQFSGNSVRDAMVSRAQMDVIKSGDSIDRIIAYVIETAHSRFPVIAEDKDHILGIIHAKDLLKYTQNPEQFKLEHILRPAAFVPEGKLLGTLLKEFQAQRNHMAIVVDEYGGISGLITFEDIIEKIVGKIEDEFDEDESADHIFPVSAERWRVQAVTPIEDINAYFGTVYTTEEADTIGGLVIHELGHLPVRGEKTAIGPLHFNVARADNRRLHTLMVTRVKDDPNTE